MSFLLFCPSCQQKLIVPETARGKKLRCPGCRTLLPAMPEPGTFSASRPVKSAPSPAAVPERGRSSQEDAQAETAAAAERMGKKSAPRRDHSLRKTSSTGLIIGLVVGGAALLLLMAGGGGALIWYFTRSHGQNALQVQSFPPPPNVNFPNLLPAKAPRGADWQTFTPPNGLCSILMPGTPRHQPITSFGFTLHKYLLMRIQEKEFYVVAFGDFGANPLPSNLLETMANAERDNLLQTLQGRVTRQTNITLGNLPGREFHISTQPQGTIMARLYLAKIKGIHRIYLAIAAGDLMTPTSEEAKRFFASFKIEGAPQPPTFMDGAKWPSGGNQPPFIMNPPQFNPPFNPPPGAPRR